MGIDVRALAAFRIALGVVLLWDLGVRAAFLEAHYTNAGVLPVAALLEERGIVLSLHALSGSAGLQIALFTAAAGAGGALLLGYRTRVATCLSWGLLVSLHLRNPYVNNSGDVILSLLLLWSMLLPLGAVWSVDAHHREPSPRPRPSYIVSGATVGILLQVALVYLYSVLHKSDPAWRSDYTALYYALSIDAFVTPIGKRLLNMPDEVLRGLTQGTLLLELWGPILAFLPVWRLRTAVAFVFVGFHASLALTMELGLFPFICIAAWLLFVPGEVWDRLERIFSGLLERARRTLGREGHGAASPNALSSAGWMDTGLGKTPASIALIFLTLFACQRSLPHVPSGSVAESVEHALLGGMEQIGFVQEWDMFAPRPAQYDGWYVMRGALENGRWVSLWGEEPTTMRGKPERVEKTYINQRWRKYFLDHYQSDSFSEKRRFLGDFLYDRWSREHPNQSLRYVEVIFVKEETPPPSRPAVREPVVLYRKEVASGDGIVESTFIATQ